jgi:hypothetical protein
VQLSAVVTRDDLVALLDQVAPVRVSLGARGSRNALLGRPHKVELVRGAGIRLGGDARMTWDVAGVALPVALRAWQVLLVPSVLLHPATIKGARRRTYVLVFDPVLEVLDFRRVPGFLDDRIADAINDVLGAQRNRLAWNFTKTLSARLALPSRYAPPGRFELAPVAGEVVVSDVELRFTVTFEAQVVRSVPTSPALPTESARAVDMT